MGWERRTQKPADAVLPMDQWFDEHVWAKWPRGDHDTAYVAFQGAVMGHEDWIAKSGLGRRISFEVGRYAEDMRQVPASIPVDLVTWIAQKRWKEASYICREFLEIWLECMRLQDQGGIRTDREAAQFFGRHVDASLRGQLCLETEALLLAEGSRRGSLDTVFGDGGGREMDRARQQVIAAAQAVGQF